MPNNSSRRRQERDRARNKATILVGKGVVATPLGEQFAPPAKMRELPAKVAGKHRWIVIASFVADEWSDDLFGDEEVRKVLGPRNMYDLSVGCIDCEGPWGLVRDEPCPAGDWEKP